MRKPIDETLAEIRKRYAAKDGEEITQLMRDVSYLFMAIRQRELERDILQNTIDTMTKVKVRIP